MKVFALLAAFAASGLPPGAGPPATQTVTITVTITALASPDAVVKLGFYNDPSKFLKDGQQAFRLLVRPGGKTELTLPVELTPGEWAVALMQDTNNNDKLDKNWLGIPTEPYAFSNNVRPRFAPPRFEECKFRVDGPGKVLRIALKP